MKQSNDGSQAIQDNRLADFTDQVMVGKVKQVETDVEEELRGLEETILRLDRAFPIAKLEEATVKQMQVRLRARMRREERESKPPFWRRWLEPQSRLQFAMAIVVMALLVVIATSPVLLTTAGSSTTATALTPMKNSLVVVLAGGVMVLLWIWMKRRK